MRFKKIGLVLAACMAVAAFSASGAQAQWTVKEAGKALSGHANVNVSGGPWTLESSVLGASVVLTAETVECTPGVECRIDNETGTNHSSGGLTFTGVTVDEPAGCEVVGGKITTEPLTDEVIMDPSGGTATFDKFFPETGSTFVEIEFAEPEGTECAIAGLTAPISGDVTGRTNDTGVLAESQPITFNAAEQSTGGGALLLGGNPATLTGVAHNVLVSGEKFGADE